MSGKAPQTAVKVAVECPHCGFKQLESSFAKSTFCRKCSEHYDIGKPLPKAKKPKAPGEGAAAPSLFTRLGNLLSGRREWELTCFHCGGRQVVSNSAKSSSCSHCGVYMDLTDFKIKDVLNRSLETQGKLHVTAKGDVTAAKVACREAFVEGKVRGHLLCTGEARLKFKGKLAGAIETRWLVIEKRSEIEALRPIKARSVRVRGKLSGRLQVEGNVIVEKKGWLEGVIVARSVTVEKGGVLLGELVIGKQELSQPELLPLDPPDSPHPPQPPSPKRERKAGARGGKKPPEYLDDGNTGPSLRFGVG